MSCHRQPRVVMAVLASLVVMMWVIEPSAPWLTPATESDQKQLFARSHLPGEVNLYNLSLCAAPAAFNKEDLGPKVAIIGAAGYIGAALHRYLREEMGYSNVRGFDRNPRATKFDYVTRCEGRGLQDHRLHQFDVVVYLGGLTGRVACETNTPEEVQQQNIQEVVDMAKRMRRNQLLIFAGTSAVAEGSGATKHLFTETDKPDVTPMDPYTLSMYRREEAMEALAADPGYQGPALVCPRFGTVVGISPSQRVEFVHVGMVRSALLEGVITVKHPESWRSFLWIRDQVRALEHIIRHHDSPSLRGVTKPRFNLYHLSSFNARVGQAANEVAQATRVRQKVKQCIDMIERRETVPVVTSRSDSGIPGCLTMLLQVLDHDPSTDKHGFLLDNEKFRSQFKFEFEGNSRKVVADLLEHKDHVLVARELLDHDHHVHGSVPCRVCGSHDMMEVLDLGMQPLANDFRPTVEDSHKCERHPLHLMRCRKCNHAQLSTLVDRKPLFTNYTYRSATSKTLDDYFSWLANKVDHETAIKDGAPKKILELACNDGTQLNHFKRLGWDTYGVDPATNLVPYARDQGHKVWNEMWGATHRAKYVGMPETFDAIVGQNVLAHVPNPVDFLVGCVERMHEDTRVYMQTSQCDMFADGQFDTVYHEHISFFSPRSFRRLAEEAGLRVVHWEISPIHGGSCLVTMMKKPDDTDPSFSNALQLEETRGQLEDTYYIRYRAQALATRDWLNHILESMTAQGHDIVGYGAAAKGMVLLHFLLAQQPEFTLQYVVDDASLKQNTYCPGTSIPVKPTAELSSHDPNKPLTIIVFSWNFWEEIRKRIIDALMKSSIPHKAVWVVLPFPRQEVVVLRGDGLQDMATLQVNPYRVPVGPFPLAPKVGMVSHFFNEELLLPYFIQNHAGVFDSAILIDSGSTDASRTVLAEYAPSNWEVVMSRDPNQFTARIIDEEVIEQERRITEPWVMALTTTEFIVHPDLVGELTAIERDMPDHRAMRFPALRFVGNDQGMTLERFPSLVEQRSEFLQKEWIGHYSRLIHRFPREGHYYSIGRHNLERTENIVISTQGFLAKWQYTPWPQALARKIQIGPRIPAVDAAKGYGFQHLNVSPADLEKRRQDEIASHGVADLRFVCSFSSDPNFQQATHAWYHVTGGQTFYKEAEDYCSNHVNGGRRRGF